MSKTILGLDLGTNSIGWALVREAENTFETSEIIRLGVRVNPLTVDEQTNFEKGKPISTNADRTLKRGARRNLHRYKLRRENLIDILIKHGIIYKDTPLTEIGKDTTHQSLMLRAKAAHNKVELEYFAKILLTINKKRGYKSSRKSKSSDEGTAIDGMTVAKILYEENITPGQYVYQTLKAGKKYIPDFYKSDLRNEINKIWDKQTEFYPTQLTNELFYAIEDKNKGQTYKILEEPWNLKGFKQSGKREEQNLERYKWRQLALSEKIELEKLAIVLQEINGNLNNSSGYLGAISDRSKKLFFNKITVGEYLYNQIEKNPHTSLKNQVFYRQDYLDEFEQIWETQAKHYPKILTPELKVEIRDVVIFYQRKLKSQKGLINFCQFESKKEEYIDKTTGKTKTRTIGQRVAPKSSPVFQEFKIWQNLNNITFTNEKENKVIEVHNLEDYIREEIFNELNLKGTLTPKDILQVISKYIFINKISEWKCNFEKIEGNTTNKALLDVYQKIAEAEGYGFDWDKKSAKDISEELEAIFIEIGVNKEILKFDSNSDDFDKQPSYQLWHLLYSAEDGSKASEEDLFLYGNNDTKLRKKLHTKYGFKPEYAKMISNISLQQDYGNLSARAMRKITPFLQAGHPYARSSENVNEVGACELAGYNHSKSETTEDLQNKILKDKLDILPKNSLRNPVVEKILNQMVNLVNQVIDEYGKPDEVRIELARELKKTADEREKMTRDIADATRRNEEIKKLIINDFGIPNPTKGDIVRYRLWDELSYRGHKTIFRDLYIPKEVLFSKDIEIEHIIPQALLFDDSYSNKTLAYHSENQLKSNRTAYDFICQEYNTTKEEYINRVETWYNNKSISRAKRNKLLMAYSDIPDGFIERDLRNTQYISKKARQMLLEVFRTVIPTTGSITDKLREDWGLINLMKELNLPKYRALGLTEIEERFDLGSEKIKNVEVIKDWTKRNDHRHHAVDALAVAFTTHNHIQYINNLNARRDTNNSKHGIIYAIENAITERVNGKITFKEPIPNMRDAARKEIESILVSYKAKNKVTTNNINKLKLPGRQRYKEILQSTPRGQLHKETIYGKSLHPLEKPIKLNSKFNIETVNLIIDKKERDAVISHISKYENNCEVAFASKTLKNNPILLNGEHLKEVKCFEEIFTIRKPISPELKLDKVIDDGIREVLQERLKEFKGNPKEAFSNIEENPIWLNKDKGISIKRVTITGVNTATPLHFKKDHLGNEILNSKGYKSHTDFVQTGNNHHVAIYIDEDGNLQESVISFYEAVERANQGLPVIDKLLNNHLGWKFQFTMKQNEMFIFPSDDFEPSEVDLLNPETHELISRNLFRVQKIGSKDYTFRHHLETTVTNNLNFTFKRINTPNNLKGIIKVRINHLGKIVQIGEY
ncbi:MAG: type II CRISPR RNA-guided endonuclease Cas9 [Fermentimonas sp.]|nr:type II CRISPR RNA-guided endonuclease Cas9 [Fermentimonas sp.]